MQPVHLILFDLVCWTRLNKHQDGVNGQRWVRRDQCGAPRSRSLHKLQHQFLNQLTPYFDQNPSSQNFIKGTFNTD